MVRRRIEIRVEREVITQVVSTRAPGWCVPCGHEVVMLSPAAAAESSGMTPREIYRWLEQGLLHFQESPDGRVSICAESLKKQLDTQLPPPSQ